jgi:transposase
MKGQQRALGFDVHREYVVIAAVDAQQEIALEPRKVWLKQLPEWITSHLRATDRVALKATSNAWPIYDQLVPLVSEVLVANPYKVKLISNSRAKMDRHDAVVLAKLMAANLLPVVWVPPPEVRELRSLIAHRQQLVRDRTAAKNRLHSVFHRHNLHLPVGAPFNDTNKTWWQTLSLSQAERLRLRHELVHIQHLSTLLAEVEAEIARLSLEAPWQDQLTFLTQLPGIGLLSGMPILSAIGEIDRFPIARNLVGYSGLDPAYMTRARYTGPVISPNRGDVSCEPCWLNVPGPQFVTRLSGGLPLSD